MQARRWKCMRVQLVDHPLRVGEGRRVERERRRAPCSSRTCRSRCRGRSARRTAASSRGTSRDAERPRRGWPACGATADSRAPRAAATPAGPVSRAYSAITAAVRGDRRRRCRAAGRGSGAGREEPALGPGEVERAGRLVDEHRPAAGADEPGDGHASAVRPELVAARPLRIAVDRPAPIELRAALAEAEHRPLSQAEAQRRRSPRRRGVPGPGGRPPPRCGPSADRWPRSRAHRRSRPTAARPASSGGGRAVPTRRSPSDPSSGIGRGRPSSNGVTRTRTIRTPTGPIDTSTARPATRSCAAAGIGGVSNHERGGTGHTEALQHSPSRDRHDDRP